MTGWPSEDEIGRAARAAAWRHPSRVLPLEARVEAARDGITEAIATGLTGDLRDFGQAGINAAVVAYCHHHGLARSGSPGHPHTGARHAAYWSVTRSRAESFADDVTDTIAVGQVMDAIHPAYQATLRAYAETGCSIAGTATALGISHTAAKERVRQARNAARTLMFSPEQAPPLWHRSLKSA